MQEKEFHKFLEGVLYKGKHLTEKGIKTRITRVKQAEELLKMDVEKMISTDMRMKQVLTQLRSNDHHGGRGNAVRKYYEMRKGTKFTDAGKDGSVEQNALTGYDNGDWLKRFHLWLIAEVGLTKNSADQYKTYINKLIVETDRVFGVGWFKLIVNVAAGSSVEKRMQCATVIEKNINLKKGKQKKVWKDMRSAFHRLEDFLDDGVCLSGCGIKSKVAVTAGPKFNLKLSTKKSASLELPIAETFTHNELFSKFKNRLQTQSRFYPGFALLFPTRLMKMIFGSKSKAWDLWLRNGIENIRILKSEDGSCELFSNVKEFELNTDGTVWVKTKGGLTFPLMTRCANGKIIKMISKERLGDVSIDHVESLESVLRKKKSVLKGLNKLTELFVKYNKNLGNVLNARKETDWVAGFYESTKDVLNTEEMRGLIENDLQSLCLEYELMDKKQNSKKGK